GVRETRLVEKHRLSQAAGCAPNVQTAFRHTLCPCATVRLSWHARAIAACLCLPAWPLVSKGETPSAEMSIAHTSHPRRHHREKMKCQWQAPYSCGHFDGLKFGDLQAMRFEEYREHDAISLAGLIAKRQVSAEEVLETAIARAEQVNPAINAIVHKQYEQARR